MIKRPRCKCGNLRRKGKVSKVTGKQLYLKKCSSCYKKIHSQGKDEQPWKKYKKSECERCGFIPEHACQLDVDHIDGNKENNCISNYKTLCANCHRIKTHRKRDSVPRKYRDSEESH